MLDRLRPFLEHLASFLAPGLVLLLLGIQVAFGLHGFDRAADGPLVILQVPGILLGWGGVVLLLPLLVWMVLDWWGYDLGGFALKALGSAVLGIAAGAFFGLFGGSVAGGVVGGGLAEVLAGTVGTIIGAIVLTIMAVPAAILAFSLRKSSARPAGTRANRAQRDARDEDGQPGRLSRILRFFMREKREVENRWYPKQRFDAWGNELPMEFGSSRDVGGIRFADAEEDAPAPADDPPPAPATATAAAPATTDDAAPPATIADLLEGEERLPTIPELLAGKHTGSLGRENADPSGGVRELATDEAEGGPVHVGGERHAEETVYPSSWGMGDGKADPRDEGLLPGVRYAEPSETPTPPADDAPAEAAPSDTTPSDTTPAEKHEEEVVAVERDLSDAVAAAVRGPAPQVADSAARMAASVREGVRRSVQAMRGDGNTPAPKSRYLEKLEASGMFEFARPLDGAPPTGTAGPASTPKRAGKPSAPKKKRAVKKKAAKKKAARKKAAKKRPAARSKAPAKKKAAAAKKKRATRRKSATRSPADSGPTAKRRPLDDPARVAARRRRAMLEALQIERLDPLFARAVDAALERGAASNMLLTRRLGLPFARAGALLERMVGAGVLGPAGSSGSHPVLLDRADWIGLQQ